MKVAGLGPNVFREQRPLAECCDNVLQAFVQRLSEPVWCDKSIKISEEKYCSVNVQNPDYKLYWAKKERKTLIHTHIHTHT